MKSVRHPDQFILAQDMSSSFVTQSIDVQQIDLAAIQLNYSGAPVGSLVLQGSVDWDERAQTGNWVDLPVSIAGSTVLVIPIPASTSPILIDMAGSSVPYVRLSYTFTSGTGSMDIHTCGKRLGD